VPVTRSAPSAATAAQTPGHNAAPQHAPHSPAPEPAAGTSPHQWTGGEPAANPHGHPSPTLQMRIRRHPSVILTHHSLRLMPPRRTPRFRRLNVIRTPIQQHAAHRTTPLRDLLRKQLPPIPLRHRLRTRAHSLSRSTARTKSSQSTAMPSDSLPINTRPSSPRVTVRRPRQHSTLSYWPTLMISTSTEVARCTAINQHRPRAAPTPP
jgi:hypothetical protein